MEEISVEPAWVRLLRLGSEPTRDVDSLCNELAWLEWGEGLQDEPEASDARALLRLAQDFLKYKQEQVNTLFIEVDKLKREGGSKRRKKVPAEESPTRSNDSYLETVAQQEEEIRANKEILDQLYADIAELEGRKKGASQKNKLELDRDSNSSREPLSEKDQVRQLEEQIVAKNKHIRKMLADIKVLEEENRQLKEKVTIVKENLSEATQFIQNLTEQVLQLKNDCTVLSETIGKTEEVKSQLTLDMDALRKKMNERDSSKIEVSEEMKAKLLHWKNHAKARKSENEILQKEIARLKKENASDKDNSYLANIIQQQEDHIKNLQEKLSEASEEILDSVKLIEKLKTENRKLKATSDRADTSNTSIASKSEIEEKKDEAILSKMKKKIHNLTLSLKTSEDTLSLREQELTELASHLQLIEGGEGGVQSLLNGLKNKRRQIKQKNIGIKSLVQELNELSQVVDGLQTENEAMREKLNIDPDEIVPTKGVLAKFHKSEKRVAFAEKKLSEMENAFVNLELELRKNEKMITKLKESLREAGFNEERMEELLISSESEIEAMPFDGGGESSTVVARKRPRNNSPPKTTQSSQVSEEMQAIIEENDGLRKGMEEILEFLKDNRNTTSGTLAVQCPSLEKVVHSLDARHAAGWYAPHMAAVMGLQAAIGGRDALLTALHEARKETFDVMEKLSKEYKKSSHLEQRLQDVENKSAEIVMQPELMDNDVLNNGVFGTWMFNKQSNRINLMEKEEVKEIMETGNKIHETQLKEALRYFHKQFKDLFQKMTEISIQTSNDHNKWAIDEEKYKAEIMSLKAQIDLNNIEDSSETSEGLVAYPNAAVVARKCTYLEESYRYIRTLNANIKNECLDNERQKIILLADFESQIQVLVLNIINLTDRLRNTVSLDLFLKQNDMLNDINFKYRKLLDENVEHINGKKSLGETLEKQKSEIIETLLKGRETENKDSEKLKDEAVLPSTELSVVKQQLDNVCKELETAKKRIKELEDANTALQEVQKKLMDSTLSLATKDEYEMMKNKMEEFMDENRSLRSQCSNISNQLEISISQLQDTQQRQNVNDLEINMLRHQVLDLQATGDNKAIIARLSGEILIAHLQTTDTSKKLDKLNAALVKEKQRRLEAEEMLRARERIFNVYAARFEFRFRYMFEVLQMLRQQYQGAIPTACIENYLNNVEELSRNTTAVEAKLTEVEDLRALLLAKSQAYEEIVEKSRMECPLDDKRCPHEIKLAINQTVHAREMSHYAKKVQLLEKSREEVVSRCNALERTLVLVNQGFDKSPLHSVADRKKSDSSFPSGAGNLAALEVEDVPSDDDEDSRMSQTITLPKPQILKPRMLPVDAPTASKSNKVDETSALFGSPVKVTLEKSQKKETTTVVVQTESAVTLESKKIQTDRDETLTKLKKEIKLLKEEMKNKQLELSAALAIAAQRAEEILSLETSKVALDAHLKAINETVRIKEAVIDSIKGEIEELKGEIMNIKLEENMENKRKKDSVNEETKALLQAVKKLENDKNSVIEEYKEILNNEREEYAKSIKEYQDKINELQEKLDKQHLSPDPESGVGALVAKYEEKVSNLEDKVFKLQNTLDGYKTELKSCQNELERWKVLASERLDKIENLSVRYEEKHAHEMESYRKENQHWLSQLADSQKECLELRSKLADHRAVYMKQLTEKDAQIEQQKSATQHLKSQMLGLQSMITASDPGFNLSGIVEVEETSDVSPHGPDRLEIKFHSSNDLIEQAMADDYDGKEPAVTSPTWHETLVDRLRREKQVIGKQNMLLRRQIKALAGRERRSRLEAQNLKTQMWKEPLSERSCVGKLSAESSTVSLNNKVAALASQLSSARRETHNANANIWDKWKRAQQLAEKWQAKYEEKSQELKKCESTLNFTKSAVARLDKEKKLLLAKIRELRNEKHISFSKDLDERNTPPTKDIDSSRSERLPPHISVQSLMDRVEAQQRRIAALELANKGHEPLVTEYEKVLSQCTLLKGQVLKLESQVLELQLTSGGMTRDDSQQGELEHLRSYCDALKEENMQLSAKVSLNSVDGATYSSTAHRINDLEQTVLTLRGLVSKLTRKKSMSPKRGELSRSGSVYSIAEQERTGAETHRTEIATLRRAITEKDLLLERSRDLLKMAAEREEQLVQEITFLRQCLDDGKTNK